jgi:hypothetical protein
MSVRRSLGKSSTRLIAGVAALALTATASAVSMGSASAADSLAYGDALGTGWVSWSWSAAVDPASTAPVESGTRALSVRITDPWGALSLRSAPATALNGGTITFAMHGGPSGSTVQLSVSTDDANSQVSPAIAIAAPANAWTRQTITADQLGGLTRVGRLTMQSSSATQFSIDDLRINTGTVIATTTTLPAGPVEGTITLDGGSAGTPFSQRMWGTNLPFYNGGYSYGDQTLRNRSRGMTGLTRYPGSQDSQRWGWASCQAGADIPNAQGCTNPNFQWTARPSDFIGFMQSVGGEPLVTVNANATSKENAAFVAFMNGSVSDTRVIGVDQRGADWRTVGYWAQQRDNAGYPNALNVKLWEFGNETYGGLPGGNQCLSYGWEVVFTCKASEFLDGTGAGAQRNDGYRATKAAMKGIDGSIQLGFPAERKLDDYNSWTREAIQNHRGDIDFFSVHPYFRWIPPADTAAGNAEILALPQVHWAEIQSDFDGGYQQYGSRRVPLLISEYNLTPGPQNDPAKRMNGMGNALMMADSVGVMAGLGNYMGSNAFDLYLTPSPDGTYFSMMRRDGSFTRNPLYWGWVLWGRFGGSRIPVNSTFNASNSLSVHAGRRDGNTLTLYVINKAGRSVNAQIAVNGVAGIGQIVADSAVGSSMYDTAPLFNDQVDPASDLSDAPGSVSSANGQRTFSRAFAPWSMTLLKLTIDGTQTTTVPTTTRPATTTVPPTTIATTVPPTTVATTVATTTRPATTTTAVGPTTTVPVTTVPVTTVPVTTVPATTTIAPTGRTCRVAAAVSWTGSTVYGVDGTITNTGQTPITGWRLAWTFAGNQQLDLSWGGSYTQSGQAVTFSDAGWNGTIAPGQSVTFGYRATFSGANSPVTAWTLNGSPCS